MKKSDVFDHLACSLGVNSDEPNTKLAAALCESRNEGAVETLIAGLQSSNPAISSDCMKVLCELGRRSPDMIADYAPVFIRLLQSKSNRMVWGSMTALAMITKLNPSDVFAGRHAVIRAYETGSVITRDESISVFAELSRADEKYERILFPLILRHLASCRLKEIPQHAERALPAVSETNASAFKSVLGKRIDLLSAPQRKRVEKILRSV